MDFLKNKDVLDYDLEKNKKGSLKEYNFSIKTKHSRFDILYRLRPDSTEYFTQEDIDEANVLRENFSRDGGRGTPMSIATIAKKGFKKDRPVILITVDYDDMGYGYNNSINGDNLVMPKRIISKEQITELEKKTGIGKDFKEEPHPVVQNKPDTRFFRKSVEEIPMDFYLSRGYTDCSCNVCFSNLKNNDWYHGADYSIIFNLKNMDRFSIEEFASLYGEVFKPTIKIKK